MMEDLSGARALVTGAGSGIGRAVAHALAGEGCRTYLVGRSFEKLRETAKAMVGPAPEPICRAADLAEEPQVEELAERVESELGGLEVLIHSAGLFAHGSVAETPVAELDRQYRTHLRAPYLLTRSLLPQIRTSKGQIVFVNSSAVFAPRAGVAPYVATKQALRALADCLRDEENEAGVRVLSVYPGRTATPMQAEVHELEGKPYRPDRLLQPEDVATAILDALKLPRTAEITDLRIRPFQKS